jgi:heme O synthase-like polyprenyltransferase
MLPVVEPDCVSTARQIVFGSVLLLPVRFFPAALGMAGALYAIAAISLGLRFLNAGLKARFHKTPAHARAVLIASVI